MRTDGLAASAPNRLEKQSQIQSQRRQFSRCAWRRPARMSQVSATLGHFWRQAERRRR